MSRSLLKLIATSLVLAIVASAVTIVAYVRNLQFSEEHARRAGVLWVLAELDETAPDRRAERLAQLQPSIDVPVALVGPLELTQRAGGDVVPGALEFRRPGPRAQWLYASFADQRGGIAVGPVDPSVPPGVFPIGLVLTAVLVPLIAIVVTLRISRQLRKVQEASGSLAAGQLSARVDNPSGPSSELAQSFNDMAARIERLVRDREELLQAVSHELGSPLARLRLQLELLAGDAAVAPNDDAQARFEAMEAQIDELDQLVEELLGWVQAGGASVDARDFDPVSPLHQLAELAQFDEETPDGVKIRVDAPSSTSFLGDPRLYQRAVGNLLRNAVRYARSQVVLSLGINDEELRVTVDDDGPGIPADRRATVLEPFARLDADRGRRSGGAGLGLAIVKRIAQSHGGTVAIGDSSLGGASVTFRWPATR